jgi:myosin-3
VITRRVKYALGNKKVAVKIQKLTPQTQCQIVEEYRVLRDLSGHPNLPDFYGIYRRRSARKSDHDEMWFVMEVSLDQSRLAK